jgi:hypothetical protein
MSWAPSQGSAAPSTVSTASGTSRSTRQCGAPAARRAAHVLDRTTTTTPATSTSAATPRTTALNRSNGLDVDCGVPPSTATIALCVSAMGSPAALLSTTAPVPVTGESSIPEANVASVPPCPISGPVSSLVVVPCQP